MLLKQRRVYNAYAAKEYKEMISMMSNLTPQQFIEMNYESLTLLHHAAHDGNIEAVSMMATLPYFKEIVNDNSNEVI